MENAGYSLYNSVNTGVFQAAAFLPNLIAGIVILLVGLFVSSLVKSLVELLFRRLNIGSYLDKYSVPQAKGGLSWERILGEIARWFVIVVFLVPTADTWGLPEVTRVLESILLYLPNVFVSVIIVLVGFVFARLVHDVVLASSHHFSKEASRTAATLARYAIVIFTVLAALHQLGVAMDLIRILFAGFVAMLALAGGLAFGLGGKGLAEDILNSFRRSLKNK